MDRFKKGSRVKFRSNKEMDFEEGEVVDVLHVDHNPTYTVRTPKGEKYVTDVAPTEIKGA